MRTPWTLPVALVCSCAASEPETELVYARIVVENISAPGALATSEGPVDIRVAPGIWAVIRDQPLFDVDTPATWEIERLAEDGNPDPILAKFREDETFAAWGSFAPPGAGLDYAQNPIGPGTSAEFYIEATDDQTLAFAGMFAPSNDVLYATPPEGVSFRGLAIGEIVDITSSVSLWDVGTELNEEPGIGSAQPETQPSPNFGPDEYGVIQRLGPTDGRYTYPPVSSFMRITLERRP